MFSKARYISRQKEELKLQSKTTFKPKAKVFGR